MGHPRQGARHNWPKRKEGARLYEIRGHLPEEARGAAREAGEPTSWPEYIYVYDYGIQDRSRGCDGLSLKVGVLSNNLFGPTPSLCSSELDLGQYLTQGYNKRTQWTELPGEWMQAFLARGVVPNSRGLFCTPDCDRLVALVDQGCRDFCASCWGGGPIMRLNYAVWELGNRFPYPDGDDASDFMALFPAYDLLYVAAQNLAEEQARKEREGEREC